VGNRSLSVDKCPILSLFLPVFAEQADEFEPALHAEFLVNIADAIWTMLPDIKKCIK
jgi:hypothetical protein